MPASHLRRTALPAIGFILIVGCSPVPKHAASNHRSLPAHASIEKSGAQAEKQVAARVESPYHRKFPMAAPPPSPEDRLMTVVPAEEPLEVYTDAGKVPYEDYLRSIQPSAELLPELEIDAPEMHPDNGRTYVATPDIPGDLVGVDPAYEDYYEQSQAALEESYEDQPYYTVTRRAPMQAVEPESAAYERQPVGVDHYSPRVPYVPVRTNELPEPLVIDLRVGSPHQADIVEQYRAMTSTEAPLDFLQRKSQIRQASVRTVQTIERPLAHDYNWVTGRLEYSHLDKAWRLRYAKLDFADQYGGSFVLLWENEDDKPDGLREGNVLQVFGRVADPGNRRATAKFEVKTTRMVDGI